MKYYVEWVEKGTSEDLDSLIEDDGAFIVFNEKGKFWAANEFFDIHGEMEFLVQ